MKLAQYGGYEGWDALPEDDSREAKARAREARNRARRSAIKAVQKLEELGEIEVVTNGGGTRNRPDHMRPNLYKIKLTCPPNCDHSAQHRLLTPDETHARLRRLLGVTDDTPEPVDNSPVDPVASESPRGLEATTPVASESPESSTNYNLGNSEPETPGVAGARETDDEDQPLDDYSDFGNLLYDSKRKFTELIAEKQRRKAAPPAMPRTPEEEAAVQALAGVECPEGFGNTSGRFHWFPGTLPGCARCGSDALDLANELETT
jgi:hypothetical protein